MRLVEGWVWWCGSGVGWGGRRGWVGDGGGGGWVTEWGGGVGEAGVGWVVGWGGVGFFGCDVVCHGVLIHEI